MTRERENPRVEMPGELYRGETAPRRPGLALLLGLLTLGLGQMYVGNLKRGLLTNLSLLTMWVLFVAGWKQFQFQPHLPMLTLLIITVSIGLYQAFHAARTAQLMDWDYLLKPFNRPMGYLTFMMLGDLLWLSTAILTSLFVVGLTPVDDSSMAPAIFKGDTVLYQRIIHGEEHPQIPKHGTLVVLRWGQGQLGMPPAIRRVVATPGQEVTVESDGRLVIDGVRLDREYQGVFSQHSPGGESGGNNGKKAGDKGDHKAGTGTNPKPGAMTGAEKEARLASQPIQPEGFLEYPWAGGEPEAGQSPDDREGQLPAPAAATASVRTGYPILQWPESKAVRSVRGPFIVPDDHVFLVGDNRDNSIDSRHFGAVSASDIIGVPAYVWWTNAEHPSAHLLDEKNILGSKILINRIGLPIH